MANITYRQSVTPDVPTEISAKGVPLTNLEIDGNLKSINNQLELLTTNTSITDDTTNVATVFPMWALAATNPDGTGAVPYRISSTKIRYRPSVDTLIVARLQGTADNVITNANLTGEVTSVGNAAIVPNTTVINKVLTGLVTTPGVVNATDTLLQAVGKLVGNDTINANLTGDVTSVGNATTLTSAVVTGKVITGFVSGAGVVAETDTLLQAVNKLDGNVLLKANSLSPVLTTPTVLAAPAVDDDSLLLANTGWFMDQIATLAPANLGAAADVGASLKWAKSDHIHARDAVPLFRAHRITTTFSLTSAAATVIVPFNAKTLDTPASSFNTTTFRWTPGTVGTYRLHASIHITGTALTSVTVELYQNAVLIASKILNGYSATSIIAEVSDLSRTTLVGDFYEVRVSATGTSPVVNLGSDKTFFSGNLVSQ